jgi:hypothetical protein
MKAKIKNEISNLLTGNKNKQDIFVATSRQPGKYEFDGKEYNSAEFEELTKNYSKVVVFTPKKPCIQVSGIPTPITGMIIVPDN